MIERCVHALELNPAYVDVAVIRWQSFTGKTAVLEATDESFMTTLAERSAGSASSAMTIAPPTKRWVFAADLGPIHGCCSVLMELPPKLPIV